MNGLDLCRQSGVGKWLVNLDVEDLVMVVLIASVSHVENHAGNHLLGVVHWLEMVEVAWALVQVVMNLLLEIGRAHV